MSIVRLHRDVTAEDGVEYELIELADFDLPLLSEPTVPGAARKAPGAPMPACRPCARPST